MIDFHTHILPQMDDGSRSLQMSLNLCASLQAQGIDLIAATPHFYASSRESIPEFLRRRETACSLLRSSLGEDAPRILCGAEVAYYDGMHASEELPLLCLEGTRLLLVEMPFTVWQEQFLRELFMLRDAGIQVVLAHVDRYLHQKSRVFNELSDAGILFQLNAGALFRSGTRRRLLRMFQQGQIAFLGSDCHDDSVRVPRMAKAVQLLREKLGDPAIDRLESAQSFFIMGQETVE